MPKVFLPILLCWCLACSSQPQETPEQFYNQGLEYIKGRDFAAAAQAFEQALAIDSTHYSARLGLAEIHLRNRRLEPALAHLRRAATQAPQRIEARFHLARLATQMQRPREARRLFRAILADDPDHIPSRLLLADLLMTESPLDPHGAIEQYQAVLQQRPNHGQARAGAAASRLRLGHFAEAAAAFQALLTERPGDQHITFLLGTALYLQGDYPGAINAYKQANDALPPDAQQRRIRQWNLRLAYSAAHGQYPGDLAPQYRLDIAPRQKESPVRFTDVAAQMGVAKKDRARGNAWGDFDGDGDLDLFTSGIEALHALYRNDGDRFVDIAAAAGLGDTRGGWAAVAADYDNDGDLDLYVTRDGWEGRRPNKLYDNDGSGAFHDAAPAAGVADSAASFTAAWADYDSDGQIDLYVAEGIIGDGTPNKLYRNQGDGTFQDRAAAAGVGHPGKTLGVAWGDYNDDGHPDLYAVDVDGPNALYQNRGDGTFQDRAVEAGVTAPVQGGYVPIFFDYDNDGDADLFVTGMAHYGQFIESQITGRPAHSAHAHLYRNDGDNRFTAMANKLGLARSFGSMGAGWGDVDLDGRVDIYLANGGPIMARFEPNILLHNREDGFADITEAAGVGNIGKGHGSTFADYDNDGDLDLYAGIGGHYPGDLWPNSLYRNDGPTHPALILSLEGTQSNRNAIGARLLLRQGEYLHHSEVGSGGAFGSTNSLDMELGLGDRGPVDELEIRWPSGRIDRYRDLEPGRLILREGDKAIPRNDTLPISKTF